MSTFLITQATGQQALATIKHLLAAGHKVHAVVRDPSKIPTALQHPSITIFKGESVNTDEIYAAAQGCQGVFLNTFPIPGLEEQQARSIVAAALKAGITSIVAASTMATGDDFTRSNPESGLFHYYTSKHTVENIAREAGFKAWTILRPGFIHIDYMLPHSLGNFPELSTKGELVHTYNPDATMPQTDVDTVGRYGAAALQDPAKFHGAAIELTIETLTISEARDIVARVSGKEITERRRAEGEEGPWAQNFFTFCNSYDFTAIVADAKASMEKFGIPMTTLEEALTRDKEHLLASLPQ